MKRIGQARLLCTLVALFLLGSGYQDATAASQPLNLCELRDAASAIIQGRVERIVSRWEDPDRKLIASEVVIRVSEGLEGAAAPDSLLTVKVRGGRIDDLGMAVSDEATFVEGEDVLLFVSSSATGNVVTAGALGKFHVTGNLAIQEASKAVYRVADLRSTLAQPRQETPNAPSDPAGGCSISPVAGVSFSVDASPAPGIGPDGYVYNGYKWFGPGPMEEPYIINVNTSDAGGSNGSADAFRNAIIAAGKTWTDVPTADFVFRYGGSTSIATTAQDNQNVIHWEDMGAGSTLAESTWWYNTSTRRILEADIRFNDAHIWDATGALASDENDLQTIATHELGHWLSLGHDNDPVCSDCPATGPVMCHCYRGGSLKRALSTGDSAGIQAIYPMPVSLAHKLYLPLSRR